jgi:uncharacterized protein with von Willebrand factor type A (vWA) domain
MKTSIKALLMIGAITYSFGAFAHSGDEGHTGQHDKGSTSNEMPAMMEHMQSMMGMMQEMHSNMGDMMKNMNDPKMKEQMQNMHENMGKMMQQMQDMMRAHEKMGQMPAGMMNDSGKEAK